MTSAKWISGKGNANKSFTAAPGILNTPPGVRRTPREASIVDLGRIEPFPLETVARQSG